MLLVALFVFVLRDPQLSTVFDWSEPELKLSLSGGVEEEKGLSLSAQDESGLREIKLEAVQGEKVLEIPLENFQSGEKRALALSEVSAGLQDGEALIRVSAVDASFWENQSSSELKLKLDTRSPRLEILSLQHVVSVAGSEFVLLSASDENLQQVGVSVAEKVFTALPLSKIDDRFQGRENLYGVLFALPMGFEEGKDRVEAFAWDSFGNKRKLGISFRVQGASLQKRTPSLSEKFLRSKLPELLESWERFSGEQAPSEKEFDEADTSQLIRWFRVVNEQYRGRLAEKLEAMLAETVSVPKWEAGSFLKPMESATSSIFGEERFYSYLGEDAGSSIHYGLDLASVRHDAVKATQNGNVVFAGEFGIYGDTVVIDHGLGLSSLYGHLSSISVEKGESVTQGQEIGRSGMTGLAGGDHLHFEYRVQNIPVRAREWWDAKWLQDHIYGKIEALTEEKS